MRRRRSQTKAHKVICIGGHCVQLRALALHLIAVRRSPTLQACFADRSGTLGIGSFRTPLDFVCVPWRIRTAGYVAVPCCDTMQPFPLQVLFLHRQQRLRSARLCRRYQRTTRASHVILCLQCVRFLSSAVKSGHTTACCWPRAALKIHSVLEACCVCRVQMVVAFAYFVGTAPRQYLSSMHSSRRLL